MLRKQLPKHMSCGLPSPPPVLCAGGDIKGEGRLEGALPCVDMFPPPPHSTFPCAEGGGYWLSSF